MTINSAPTTAPASQPPAQGKRWPRRAFGTAAIVIGVIGLVLCIGLLIGGWVARGIVMDRVDGLVGRVSTGLERTATLADDLTARIDQATAKVTAVQAGAQLLIRAGSVAQAQLEALRQTVSEASLVELAGVRRVATGIRERSETLAGVLGQLQRTLPDADFVTGLNARIDTLNGRLDELEQAAGGLQTDSQAGASPGDTVTGIEKAAGAVIVVLGLASTGAGGLADGARDVEARLASSRDSVNRLTILFAGIGSAFIIYLGLLHLGLIGLGRSWRRRETGASASAPAGPETPEPPPSPAV